MATYRVWAPARLCFDIRGAESESDALARADALLGRLDDGVDLDNVDTEEELCAGVVYPAAEVGPVRVVQQLEDEEEPG